jgi:hypothetical protein
VFNPVHRRFLAVFFALSCLGACGDDEVACVEPLSMDCNPLYDPSFEEIFTRTLQPGCALEGSSCHSGASAKAGLRMDDIDMAYELLVPGGRVLPGDASCSLLVTRLTGANGGVMPPGNPLSEAERCAIETWVANGAVR